MSWGRVREILQVFVCLKVAGSTAKVSSPEAQLAKKNEDCAEEVYTRSSKAWFSNYVLGLW